MRSIKHLPQYHSAIRYIVPSAALFFPLLLTLFVAVTLPALRQDWNWFPFQGELRQTLSFGTSGWIPIGIGAPRPYPTTYVITVVILALRLIAGNHLAFFLFVFGIAVFCALAARTIAVAAGAGYVGQVAAIIFALFNPWVYTKIVAGHLFMIVAVAALVLLAAEITAQHPRTAACVFYGAVVLCQIQFYLLSIPLLVWLVLRRKTVLPLISAIILGGSIAAGIVLDRSTLLQVPYTVAWEQSQSIHLQDAVLLKGYFTGYASHFSGMWTVGMLTVSLLAGVGSYLTLRWKPKFLPLTFVTCVVLIASTGVYGPATEVFVWCVEHVHESGLFRELYDLLGLVAFAYVGLCAIAVSRWKRLGPVWLFASLACLAVWISFPPSRYWVAAESLPPVHLFSAENTRFALIPAFQPLRFGGHGSGTDPDAYPRRGNFTPINEYLPSYPSSVALGRILYNGRDTSMLRALSVSVILERPWYKSDVSALREQEAFQDSGRHTADDRSIEMRLKPVPELSIGEIPAVGSLDTNIGAGNVFYGDVAGLRGAGVPVEWKTFGSISVIEPTNRFVNARDGWVDSRLAFREMPSLGQQFGGAATSNPRSLLPVGKHGKLLVWVRGRLAGVGRGSSSYIVSGTTNGYRWVSMRKQTQYLRCTGLCVVATQGSPPDGLPLNPPPRRYSEVRFVQITPWLASTTIRGGGVATLRYNVAYDPHWVAFVDGRYLTHFRIDGAVNGWIVPARGLPHRVWLVETAALVQAILEVIAYLWLIGLTIPWGLASLRGPKSI